MDIQDHLNVVRKGGIIMKLKNNELKMIKAGAGITAALVNAIMSGINSFLDIGRYLGSSIRRITSKNNCQF